MNTAADSAAWSAANPYVGPRAFEEGETLYGRDRELAQLLDRLLPHRVVLMYSPSGAGKTSLIHAGLIPRIREAGFHTHPVIRAGTPVIDPPGAAATVSNRYLRSAYASLDLWPDASAQGSLHPVTLRATMDKARRDKDALELLIFDQFEEVLALDPTDVAVKEEFFEQVGDALRDQRRWALFAMREDSLAGLDPYLRHFPAQLTTRYRLDLLGRQAAALAIQEPARSCAVTFDDTAVEALIEDLSQVRVQAPDGHTVLKSGRHVEPAQLQVVCQQLWDRLPRGTALITHAHIQQLGNVGDALRTFYERKIDDVSRAVGVSKRVLHHSFTKELITAQGFRAQVQQIPTTRRRGTAEVTRLLEQAHLIRSEHQRGATWYELSHDVLIEPIRNSARRRKSRMLRRLGLLVGVFAVVGAVLAAQSVVRSLVPPPLLPCAGDPASLRVGVSGNLPGWSVVGETSSGFDIDLALYLARRRQMTATFITLASSQRESSLQDCKVDLVIATYSITDRRSELVDFAGPYFYTTSGIIYSPTKFAALHDPTGIPVSRACTAMGSTAAQQIGAAILVAPTTRECVERMIDPNDNVLAVAGDQTVLTAIAQSIPDSAPIKPGVWTGLPSSSQPERYGIGVRNNSPEFCRTILADLNAFLADPAGWDKAFRDNLAPSQFSIDKKPNNGDARYCE